MSLEIYKVYTNVYIITLVFMEPFLVIHKDIFSGIRFQTDFTFKLYPTVFYAVSLQQFFCLRKGLKIKLGNLNKKITHFLRIPLVVSKYKIIQK